MDTRTAKRTMQAAAAVTLALIVGLVATGLSAPAEADVTFSQNVRAVGEKKYVTTFNDYGPGVYTTICWPRGGCASNFMYWRVARGKVTTRLTTFKVTENIKAYDYFLLDYDVAITSRSGSFGGGTGKFSFTSVGPKLVDRNDSNSIKAKDAGGCVEVAVSMSTPWPVVTASASVGTAVMCNEGARLTRAKSGARSAYVGTRLRDVSHLTMQRWVKVRAGRKPGFDIRVVLPADVCTKGDGKGHCTAYDNRTSAKALAIATTG